MIDLIYYDVQIKMKDHAKRWRHVLGVHETAEKLARIHHVDPWKANIAALYHDMAKYDTMEAQVSVLDPMTISHYQSFPVMYHAFAAAAMLEKNYNIHDEEILNAIRYHVWGRPKMSKLEQIILISDTCEPNRRFADAKHIYEVATQNLDCATVMVMKASIDYLKTKHLYPSPEQLEAYYYYKEVICGKTA